MELTLKNLYKNPLFRIGLYVRLAMLLLLTPEIQSDWFVPFISGFLDQPSVDPWTSHIAIGGSNRAYPYGPVMFLFHLPFVFIGSLIDGLLGVIYFEGVGFRLAIATADFVALWALLKIFPHNINPILVFYWLSPMLLFVNYWHGQTDIVPVALMLITIYLLKEHKLTGAGITLAFTVAAKHSMIIILPFVIIYIFRKLKFQPLLTGFMVSTISTSLLISPVLFSSGFQEMALGSLESERIYQLSVSIGPGVNLYITPLIYVLMLYAMWRITWISFDILLAIMGLAFFSLILLTPSPVGWYLWLLPFLVAHQLKSGRTSQYFVFAFSLLIISYHSIFSKGPQLLFMNIEIGSLLNALSSKLSFHGTSIWLTLITCCGGILGWQILREGIRRNEIYNIGRTPLSIGIAGDSGSGKDTYGSSLVGLFGGHSVGYLSGDGYHIWDRYGGMWNALTHLNPKANYIDRFCRDVLALLDRRSIISRSYDHNVGRFAELKTQKVKNVIIVAGLHTLYPQTLANKFDVRIYLDLSEDLRHFWKIQRDTHERDKTLEGVIESLQRREVDARQFIHPQKFKANLIFKLMPVNSTDISASNNALELRLKLQVTIRGGSYYERLSSILIGLCGLHLEKEETDETDSVVMVIEGDVDREDIILAVKHFDLNFIEILDISPNWQDGMSGVMQLITLIHLDEVLRARQK